MRASCAKPNLAARTIDAMVPDRPAIAVDRGAVGTVAVRVELDASGDVLGASIQYSAGDAALDAAALEAARHSRFAPEIVDCAPHSGTYLFRVDFTG